MILILTLFLSEFLEFDIDNKHSFTEKKTEEFSLKEGLYFIECFGAQGGQGYCALNSIGSDGGKGAYISGILAHKNSELIFYATVGGRGAPNDEDSYLQNGRDGGYNGGGSSIGASSQSNMGGGGGGASDIKVGSKEAKDRIIVASGGSGGASFADGAPGGTVYSLCVDTDNSSCSDDENNHRSCHMVFKNSTKTAKNEIGEDGIKSLSNIPGSGAGAGYFGGLKNSVCAGSQLFSYKSVSCSGSSYISGYPELNVHTSNIRFLLPVMISGANEGDGKIVITKLSDDPNACVKYNENKKCIQCFDKLFLYEDKCVDACPEGTKQKDGKCEKPQTFPFSHSSVFSNSDDFSRSSFFTKSDQFLQTDDFSRSTFFSESKKFSNSFYFSNSADFSRSSFFTNSDQFLQTDDFSRSTFFSESKKFLNSFYFSKSIEFSNTFFFSKSSDFSKSSIFSEAFDSSETDFSPSSGDSLEPQISIEPDEPAETTFSLDFEKQTESQNNEDSPNDPINKDDTQNSVEFDGSQEIMSSSTESIDHQDDSSNESNSKETESIEDSNNQSDPIVPPPPIDSSSSSSSSIAEKDDNDDEKSRESMNSQNNVGVSSETEELRPGFVDSIQERKLKPWSISLIVIVAAIVIVAIIVVIFIVKKRNQNSASQEKSTQEANGDAFSDVMQENAKADEYENPLAEENNSIDPFLNQINEDD